MDRYRSLIAALPLACAIVACNAVFGLDPTIGPDSDRDGLDDGHDNCPLVANADQTNRDGDTFGDACDPCDGPQSGTDHDGDGIDDTCDACPTGPNTDEDGDTHLDGCDVCPGVADDQADADGDGVGDACDAEPGVANHRIFFDGFDAPRTGWRAWLAVWHEVDGALTPAGAGGGAVGAWHPDGAVTGNEFWFETVADIPTQAASSGEYMGIGIVERSAGSLVQLCWIIWDAGRWHPFSDLGQNLTPGSTVRIRYHAHAGADECAIDGMPTTLYDEPVTPATYVAGLSTGTHTAFHWIDVVAR